ncbi:MAG: hypothetical protein PHF12_00020 [Candidatus Omnitrophica bacterium]|nr:hypothetical protein [Candidatus Omnitrophota bacterium]
MTKKSRLGLYLEDEDVKRRIKVAAARRGISTTAYCAEAIRERLQRDGEVGDKTSKERLALLSRMDKLRKETGPIGVTTAELVEEGRRR